MNPKEANRAVSGLSRALALTKKSIIAELVSSDTYILSEKKRILRNVNAQLKELVGTSDEWFLKNLTRAYMKGSGDVVGFLKRLGVKRVLHTDLDRESIDNIIGNSQATMGDAISGISRSASRILSSATQARIQAQIEEGVVSSSTLKTIASEVADSLKKQNIYIIDSAGRKWDVEKYSKMVARTELMNTYNAGVINQMTQHNHDLGKITSYATCKCDICIEWEDKIVSLSGKSTKYPPLEQAYNEGVFHPNCKHRVRPYIEPLVQK